MTITLDLSPLQELKITEIARQKGVEPLEYVRGLLELKPSSILETEPTLEDPTRALFA